MLQHKRTQWGAIQVFDPKGNEIAKIVDKWHCPSQVAKGLNYRVLSYNNIQLNWQHKTLEQCLDALQARYIQDLKLGAI